MKKHKLKKIITFALVCATIGTGICSTKSTIAKGINIDSIYSETYRNVEVLQNYGSQYHITPRLANNGSKMEDNLLLFLVDSVNYVQATIDRLRENQHQFPSAYWKARNTFSEIGDGYQQPIYEWIVDIAIKSQKETKGDWNKSLSNIMKLQYKISSAMALNKGVDIAYRGAYQAALDDVQARIDKAVEEINTNEIRQAQNFGKYLGNTLDNQEKITTDLSKKLKDKYNHSTLISIRLNIESALINIIKNYEGTYSNLNKDAKFKTAYIDATIRELIYDYVNGKYRQVNDSELYRFNEFVQAHKKYIIEGLDELDEALIDIRLEQLNDVSKIVERSCGKDNIKSFEDAFMWNTSREISWEIGDFISMDIRCINNLETVNSLPEEIKVVAPNDKGKFYHGDLGSASHLTGRFSKECEFYYNRKTGIVYKICGDKVIVQDAKNNRKTIAEYDLKNKKFIMDNRKSEEKQVINDRKDELKYEDELRKKQEAEKEKAYQDIINKDAKEKTLEDQQSEEIKHEDKIINDEESKREKIYDDLSKQQTPKINKQK